MSNEEIQAYLDKHMQGKDVASLTEKQKGDVLEGIRWSLADAYVQAEEVEPIPQRTIPNSALPSASAPPQSKARDLFSETNKSHPQQSCFRKVEEEHSVAASSSLSATSRAPRLSGARGKSAVFADD